MKIPETHNGNFHSLHVVLYINVNVRSIEYDPHNFVPKEFMSESLRCIFGTKSHEPCGYGEKYVKNVWLFPVSKPVSLPGIRLRFDDVKERIEQQIKNAGFLFCYVCMVLAICSALATSPPDGFREYKGADPDPKAQACYEDDNCYKAVLTGIERKQKKKKGKNKGKSHYWLIFRLNTRCTLCNAKGEHCKDLLPIVWYQDVKVKVDAGSGAEIYETLQEITAAAGGCKERGVCFAPHCICVARKIAGVRFSQFC